LRQEAIGDRENAVGIALASAESAGLLMVDEPAAPGHHCHLVMFEAARNKNERRGSISANRANLC
jgi:hypothetical protein